MVGGGEGGRFGELFRAAEERKQLRYPCIHRCVAVADRLRWNRKTADAKR